MKEDSRKVVETSAEKNMVPGSILSKPILVCLACLVIFISSLSYEFPNAFFPLYNRSRGIDPIWNGIFIGFCCLGVLIACLVTPHLMNNYPTRPLLTGTAVALGVSTMLFALVDNFFEPVFYEVLGTFTRALSGALAGVLEVTSFAGLVSIYPDKVATTTAIGEGVLNGALAFGPFLGSVIYSNGGLKIVFILLGSVFALCGIPAAFTVPLDGKQDEDEPENDVKPVKKSVLNPWILFPFFHQTVMQVLNTFHYPIISIYVYDFLGEGVVWTGSALLLNDIFICVSSPIWGILIDKFNPHYAMALSSILMPLSYMFLGPLPLLTFISPSKAQLLSALAVLGIVIPLACIPTLPIAFDVYRSQQGSLPRWASNVLVSIYCASFPLGGFLGSTLAGFMDQYLSFRWSTGTMALVCFVEAVLCCIYCCAAPRSDNSERRPISNGV